MIYSKYGNKRIIVDGISCDSLAEAARWQELTLLQQAGEISGLRHHPRYTLQPGFRRADGKWERAIVYEADFQFVEQGRVVVEETKGFCTEAWGLKRKMMLFCFPEVDLRVLNVSAYHRGGKQR